MHCQALHLFDLSLLKCLRQSPQPSHIVDAGGVHCPWQCHTLVKHLCIYTAWASLCSHVHTCVSWAKISLHAGLQLPCAAHALLWLQVLSPVKKSPIGTEQLNVTLQPFFNPPPAATAAAAAKSQGWEWAPRVGNYTLRVGDRVTHLKNDVVLDVYNGDQGYVDVINKQARSVTVRYPPRSRKMARPKVSSSYDSDSDSDGSGSVGTGGAFHRVTYQGSDITDMLQPAWATTVHKVGMRMRLSQCILFMDPVLKLACARCKLAALLVVGLWGRGVGKAVLEGEVGFCCGVQHKQIMLLSMLIAQAQGGEFPVVVLPIHNCAGRLRRRELLYTAVSRAQKLLVLVGNMAAIQACIHNAGPDNNAEVSRFRAKLRSARVKAGLPTIRRAVYGPGGWE